MRFFPAQGLEISIFPCYNAEENDACAAAAGAAALMDEEEEERPVLLLIRNGLVYTMTACAPVQADILTDGGRILRVEERIDPTTLCLERVIEAQGYQVFPGLIDAHTHLLRAERFAKDDAQALAEAALQAGVTTYAVWPEEPGACLQVRHGAEAAVPRRPIRCLKAEGMGEEALRQALTEAAAADEAVAAEVHEEATARLLLRLQAECGAQVLLVHATGCEALADVLAQSGCGLVAGACCRRGRGSAYALAARMSQAGVPVALTCDYPATRLHHLPLGAGLCVRAGMAPMAALRAITIDAARLLGVAEACGSLEPGKRADIAIFDGNPLMLATAKVMTLCAGQVVDE